MRALTSVTTRKGELTSNRTETSPSDVQRPSRSRSPRHVRAVTSVTTKTGEVTSNRTYTSRDRSSRHVRAATSVTTKTGELTSNQTVTSVTTKTGELTSNKTDLTDDEWTDIKWDAFVKEWKAEYGHKGWSNQAKRHHY